MQVLVKTTLGDLDVELWAKETPLACRNFVQLCMEGYYDGTIFHRIVKGMCMSTISSAAVAVIKVLCIDIMYMHEITNVSRGQNLDCQFPLLATDLTRSCQVVHRGLIIH